MTKPKLDRANNELQHAMRLALDQDVPEGLTGRGIVTCAGGARLFTNVYVLIRILRETLGCTLPTEVWSFGPDELTPHMRRLLEELDVSLIDAEQMLARHPANISNGWQLKPYAILHSRFVEVLFLDADQVPVRDPSVLFDEAHFQETGAVFWPDTVDLRHDNPIWDYIGLEGIETPSWESGQILVDKRRHWGVLCAALCLNADADQVYQMVYGDAATFTVAWRWSAADVAVIPHRPFRDPRVIVQRDFDGAPLFQHRTDAKWVLGGQQYAFEGEVHREDCLRYLAELDARWSGRMFRPPDRSIGAREAEVQLADTRAILEMRADHVVELELLAGHELGAGRSADRQNWYVTEDKDGLTLILSDGWRVSYRLKSVTAGIWEGQQEAVNSAAARMVETGTGDTVKTSTPGLVEQLVLASGTLDDPEGQLEAALTLLLRAEPGLRETVAALSTRWPHLSDLSQKVLAANGPTKRAPTRDLNVLANGYKNPSQAH